MWRGEYSVRRGRTTGTHPNRPGSASPRSSSRAHKALLQEEVDAIGTTYVRALLLPPQRQTLTVLLRAYVTARLEFGRAEIDKALLEAASVSAARIAAQLWTLASAVAAHNPSGVLTGLFMQVVNDMINVTEKRRAAQDNHVPETVLHLLFTVAVGALGFLAYGYGLTGQRHHGADHDLRRADCAGADEYSGPGSAAP